MLMLYKYSMKPRKIKKVNRVDKYIQENAKNQYRQA